MKPILIYGSREFGRVLKYMLVCVNREFGGFIDDISTGDEIIGDYESVRRRYSPDKYQIVMGVGYKDLQARWNLFQRVLSDGFDFPTLLHPTAYVHNANVIGAGTIIMAGAVVDVNVEIGSLSVVWPGVVLNHDSRIGNNCFLSPNSTVCGCVEIGDDCFIGAGAVIVDHNCVPDKGLVKAGQVYYHHSGKIEHASRAQERHDEKPA